MFLTLEWPPGSKLRQVAIVRKRRTLRIGQVARASGLSPDTLRYYERIGLLPRARRTSGGFREYPEDIVNRVEMIQRSLVLGFTLAELAEIFEERAAGRAPCRRVRALAAEKLHVLEATIAEMQRLREALQQTLKAWDAKLEGTGADGTAGLLESLADLVDIPPARDRVPPRPIRGRRT